MITSRFLIISSVAVIAAGCGSAKPPATAGQSAGGPAAAAYRYANCMRAHGITNFPDPRVTESSGSTRVAVMAPQSSVHLPKFKSADRACQRILPGPGQARSGQLAQKPELLAFARCMRSRGISSFPDPDPTGSITREMLAAAGVDLHSHATFRAAISCIGVTHGAITAAQVHDAVSGAH